MKVSKAYITGLVIFLLLVGCNLRPGGGQLAFEDTPTPTRTTVPTITPIPMPTRRATFELFPSPTRAPSITPWPSWTPIAGSALEGLQAEVTKARFKTGAGPYQCKVTSIEPSELEVVRPKEEFTGIFRMQNVGKASWSPNDIAYFYISGTRFQTGKYKESFIPYVVNYRDPLNLQIPMRAPGELGVYFSIWGLRIKSLQQFFCTFSISITVDVQH